VEEVLRLAPPCLQRLVLDGVDGHLERRLFFRRDFEHLPHLHPEVFERGGVEGELVEVTVVPHGASEGIGLASEDATTAPEVGDTTPDVDERGVAQQPR
jgi:hypothetical protein